MSNGFVAGLGSLTRRIPLNGTLIVVATVVATNLLRIVSSVTLTRILAPEAFGAIGVVMSIAFIVTMISDLGFQAFIVRHRDGDKPAFLDVIWTVRLIRSLVLALLILALSGPISLAINKPGLQPLIAVSSILFLLEGVSSVALITAVRERRLGKLSLVEIGEALAQLIIAILLSLLWRNVWGIIVAMLLGRGLRALLSYVLFENAARRPALDRGYIRELWSFSRFVIGSSAIMMLISQTDKVVLSRLFALDIFGLYIIAVSLAAAPAAFTSAFSSRVLYPLYAEALRENPKLLPEAFRSAGRRPMLLYMLAAGAFPALGPSIIAILYDPRYIDAAAFLQLLAIAPVFALSNAAASEALVATGEPRAVFRANIARLAWLAAVGTIAYLNLGPIGVAFAVGTMELPALLYNSFALSRHGLFSLRREAIGFSVAAGGFVLGLLVNQAVMNYAL